MKKIAKHITAAILSVCLFCMTAISALAYTEGYFRYEITDGVLTITEYFGREEDVTVPNMIAGTPVSVIGENVFPEGCGVKRVNLPDTIMKVHANSFAGGITVVYNSNITTTTTTAAPQTGTTTEIVTTPQNTGTNPAVTSAGNADNSPVITETRTENGAVYIEEVTEDEDEPEDIGEGGMEEDEDVIIDITPADTSVPDYIVIAPGTGTVSETATTKPAATEESAASTSANENGEAAAATDETGEAATTAGEDKPTAEDGAIAEPGDNAPATENSPESSADKLQNNSTLVSVIIYAVAAIAVAAVVIIVLVKRKKK
ncbi:MAG: hypothetical protein ACI4KR_06795 [Ruminiclostridium sp.]